MKALFNSGLFDMPDERAKNHFIIYKVFKINTELLTKNLSID